MFVVRNEDDIKTVCVFALGRLSSDAACRRFAAKSRLGTRSAMARARRVVLKRAKSASAHTAKGVEILNAQNKNKPCVCTTHTVCSLFKRKELFFQKITLHRQPVLRPNFFQLLGQPNTVRSKGCSFRRLLKGYS